MRIHNYGEKNTPVIIMLPGSFATRTRWQISYPNWKQSFTSWPLTTTVSMREVKNLSPRGLVKLVKSYGICGGSPYHPSLWYTASLS